METRERRFGKHGEFTQSVSGGLGRGGDGFFRISSRQVNVCIVQWAQKGLRGCLILRQC